MSRSLELLMARRGLFPAAVLLLLLAPACGVSAFAEPSAPAVTGAGAQHSPDGREHAAVISCEPVPVGHSSGQPGAVRAVDMARVSIGGATIALRPAAPAPERVAMRRLRPLFVLHASLLI